MLPTITFSKYIACGMLNIIVMFKDNQIHKISVRPATGGCHANLATVEQFINVICEHKQYDMIDEGLKHIRCHACSQKQKKQQEPVIWNSCAEAIRTTILEAIKMAIDQSIATP